MLFHFLIVWYKTIPSMFVFLSVTESGKRTGFRVTLSLLIVPRCSLAMNINLSLKAFSLYRRVVVWEAIDD